jgi:hypothetical protein
MLETFDLSLVFPLGYEPVHAKRTILNSHDTKTTSLLEKALSTSSKPYLNEQWNSLKEITGTNQRDLESLTLTNSRYRIGLLHIYLIYRLWEKIIGNTKILDLISFLMSTNQQTKSHGNLEKLMFAA